MDVEKNSCRSSRHIIPSIIIIIIIVVLRHFSALQHGLDGFPAMLLSHITRFRTIGNVTYTGVEAGVLWPDALPDANPTYS